MDSVIREFPAVPFGEMNFCHRHGIMYQRDMTPKFEYKDEYFQRYLGYEGSETSKKLNAGRTAITSKYCDCVLDIGIGSGEFIKSSKIKTYGYDINPHGVAWLKETNRYADPYDDIPPDVKGVTLWDAMEHIADPGKLLDELRTGQYVFISMPIFDDLLKVRSSKHYKPDEHYYYFTSSGLVGYLEAKGFSLVEVDDYESRAGRENIFTFVFRR